MKRMLWAALFAAMFGVAARAQDAAGDWQGTLHNGKDLRVIVRIIKVEGKLQATMYSIDQGAYGIKASLVTLDPKPSPHRMTAETLIDPLLCGMTNKSRFLRRAAQR